MAFVDLETTGTSASHGRIIEIGIIKVEGDKILREFETLVNPETRIDPFIEQMTGIRYEELENAPVFSSVKDEILEILGGCIFVAHNVRFDYGFIRTEFKREGISYTSKHFDTVKLARLLYPGHARYNLDAIMERFNIQNVGRHRAFGDAKVIWDFYKLSKDNLPPEIFTTAMKTVLKNPSLPPSIGKDVVDKLPEGPGVYMFMGEGESNLYIGKSVNIKDRVLSHFANDYVSATDTKIAQSIKSIEVIETSGELSALLLESTLIKKYKPIFNKVLRESRKMLALVKTINEQGYNTIVIKESDQINVKEIENILGVFRSHKQLKDSVYEICKNNGLCPRLMGFEKGKGGCFYSQIGQCRGACNGKELNLKYNLRFDEAFINKKVRNWKFNGPIYIKENPEHPELHVIDKWCYLGSIADGESGSARLKNEYRFDYDTYKILRRFIGNPNNLNKINTIDIKLLEDTYEYHT